MNWLGKFFVKIGVFGIGSGVILFLFMIYGWCCNIYIMIDRLEFLSDRMLMLRIIGIIFFPLGAFLGFK